MGAKLLLNLQQDVFETVPSTTPTSDTLVIEVPLELRTAYLVNQFRQLLSEHDKRAKTAQAKSRALYPVESWMLQALHIALMVYDAVRQMRLPRIKKLWTLFDVLTEEATFNVSEKSLTGD